MMYREEEDSHISVCLIDLEQFPSGCFERHVVVAEYDSEAMIKFLSKPLNAVTLHKVPR